MKSMRKTIIASLPLILLFSLVLPISHGQDEVGEMKVIVDKNIVYTNETFNVSIFINSSQPINLAEASITFNASLMEALSVENGGLFEMWMDDLLPGFTEIDNINGTVKYMLGASTNAAPISGIFATITFKAKNASGISSIDFIEDVSATCFGAGTEKWLPILTPSTIAINPVNIAVEVSSELVGNQTFLVNITIDPHGQTMKAASCTLNFDSDILQIKSFEYGALFSSNIGNLTPVDNINGAIGPIVAYDLAGVSKAGTLISILFQPKQTGFSYLNLTSIEIKDMSDRDMGVFSKNAYVEADIDPPDVTLEFGAPYYNGSNWISSTTPIYINASDAHDYTIYYRIDNGSLQTGLINTNLILYVQDEGLHYIKYNATDALNNTSPTYNVTFYVDNTPPETTATLSPTSPDGENGWYISIVTVNFTANDGGSGVGKIYYKIDGGAWNEYTGEFTITEGSHTLYYYAIDNVGNEEEEKSMTIKIDETSPVLSYNITGSVGNNGWYVSSVTINLTAIETTSGLAEFKYKTNAEWIDYTQPFILADGVYSIKVYAKDVAGNEANISFDVKVDKTKPSATHTLQGKIEDGKYTSDVTVILSASDGEGSGVKEIHYRLDGGNWQIFSGTSGSDTVATEGTHTIEYYAVDNAGNVGVTKQATFTIEKNKKPVADFSFSPSQPTDLDTITFADKSTDEDGEVVSWLWEFGDGSTSTEQNPTHQYADNGTYVVKLTVTDDKGATASTQKIIEVANVAPVAKFKYEPDKPKVREEIKFNSSLSFDDDGNIVNYTWDFGDGNISYEANPTHAYEKAGTYNVTLTIMDNDGATHTTMLPIKVTEEKINVWLYLIIIVVLIIIAIAVVAVWKRRTKS